MDIKRVSGAKNKVTLNHNRERVLVELVPPLLGWGHRIRFALQRTFSEDLSEDPLTATLDAAGVNGLHQAIRHRIADLGSHTAGRWFPDPRISHS